MPRIAELTQLPLPTLIVLGILVAIVAAVLLWTTRRAAPPASSSANPTTPPWQDPGESLESLRRASAHLDAKIADLQRLIAEADRAAGRLEAAVSAAAKTRDDVPDAAARLQRLAPPPIGFEETFGPPVSQAEALRPAGAVDRPAPTGLEGPERAPLERRYEPMYALADSGLDAVEIARRTGTPVGEVQLILSLRPRRP